MKLSYEIPYCVGSGGGAVIVFPLTTEGEESEPSIETTSCKPQLKTIQQFKVFSGVDKEQEVGAPLRSGKAQRLIMMLTMSFWLTFTVGKIQKYSKGQPEKTFFFQWKHQKYPN